MTAFTVPVASSYTDRDAGSICVGSGAAFTQWVNKRPLTSILDEAPRKIRRITSSLPTRLATPPAATADEDECSCSVVESSVAPVSPQDFIISTIKSEGEEATMRSSADVEDFFLEHSEEQMESYGVLSQAVRSRNLPLLRKMHQDGVSMRCSNRFGESLIHMACRRGYLDVAKFFVQEADVSLRVRDDYGRTPLHDACWTTEPNMELMDMMLKECPELLLISDKRGHAPFQYTRRENWASWVKFLSSRKELLCVRRI